MDLRRLYIPLTCLIGTAFIGSAGCAHQTAMQPDAPVVALPPTGALPAPKDSPEAPPRVSQPAPITESAGAPVDFTEAAMDTTEAATGATETTWPTPERASPPALGATTLTELADPKFPSRKASLSLAQEGRLAWLNHDPQDARQKLQSSLQIWGGNPYAHYYLGMLELQAGHYASAATFARKAIRDLRANPYWNARAHLLLSECLDRQGDRAGAFGARASAFELDPRAELR